MAQMTPFELFGLKPAFKVDLEALHAAHREDLIGAGPGCLLPPPGAKRAAPVKKPKTTRPVPEKRLHKAKRHR